MKLKIKIVNENAIGLYNTDETEREDSGLDLYVLNDVFVKIGQTSFIDLGIQCEMVNHDKKIGYFLVPRSSISKTPLILANSIGIIDSGYRGNIIAAVKYIPYNLNSIENEPMEYKINKGTRLFQICSPTLEPFTTEVSNTLSDSQRGSEGFGSTGV